MNKSSRRLLRGFVTLSFLLVSGAVIWINDHEIAETGKYIYYSVEDLPQAQTVMILGASVLSDGRLSRIAQDRADIAIQVWRAGKVPTILISADNNTTNYDETRTIRDYLINQGVSTGAIFQDFAGFDTYDSMFRAHDIFQVESMIVATQKFHQPRAVYLARSMGINTVGIIADSYVYSDDLRNNLREMFARVKAFIEIKTGSQPKFRGEKIPIMGKSNWDM